jgi:UDP-N-acetylmuramyl tripeptide synthase
MGKLPLRARLATTIGGAAGKMSRLAGRGDGSVIGGVIGLRVEPDLLALLAAGRRVVLVTGTNGKTTTTRLITAALGALGQEVASNAFGANMEAGLAAALGQAPDAPLAVLEVDEKYLPTVLGTTRAWAVALLNLSRDQMDRAAEDLARGPQVARGARDGHGLPGGRPMPTTR